MRSGPAARGVAARVDRHRVLPSSAGVVDPADEHPHATIGRLARRRRRRSRRGARGAARRDRCCSSANRASGKTTLIVEALRRLDEPPVVCVPGRRRRRERRPDVHRDARGPRAGDRRRRCAARDRLALPELRGGALVGAAPAEPAWPARRAAARTIESGEATVIGEIDPLAYELLIQHRPRSRGCSRWSGSRR